VNQKSDALESTTIIRDPARLCKALIQIFSPADHPDSEGAHHVDYRAESGMRLQIPRRRTRKRDQSLAALLTTARCCHGTGFAEILES
jgi:hypothetical protein